MKRKSNLAVVEKPQETQIDTQSEPDYDKMQKRLARIAISLFDLIEEMNNCLKKDSLYLISEKSASIMVDLSTEVFGGILNARAGIINATRKEETV